MTSKTTALSSQERATNAEYSRAYRERHPGRAAEAQRRYLERYPERRAATAQAYRDRNRERTRELVRIYSKVLYAVRTGKLTRQPCHCGEVRVHAHHHNGYGPGHELDVVWLCPKHHRKEHSR